MANQRLLITVHLEDIHGGLAVYNMYGYVDNSMTVALISNFVYIIADAIDGVCSARVRDVSFCFVLPPLAGFKTVPAADSDRSISAKFKFLTAEKKRSYSVIVPSFRRDLFISGTDEVNLSNFDVATVVSILQNGFAVIHADDENFRALTALLSAKKVIRTYRK